MKHAKMREKLTEKQQLYFNDCVSVIYKKGSKS